MTTNPATTMGQASLTTVHGGNRVTVSLEEREGELDIIGEANEKVSKSNPLILTTNKTLMTNA